MESTPPPENPITKETVPPSLAKNLLDEETEAEDGELTDQEMLQADKANPPPPEGTIKDTRTRAHIFG
jgi:hypothetical protein